ncbi:MAG TPA: peptide chain release factor 2 [Candidatus Babeliales bacterium]|nr:peptide chain release factor 2 [Candidatus Babeliales bacterium]
MLIDELREKLKSIEPDLETIKTYWKNSTIENEFQKLTTQTEQTDFWQNPDQTTILKSLQRLKTQRELYHSIINSHKDLLEMIELFANDESELASISRDVGALVKSVGKFKIDLLLNNPEDSSNTFLNINAGAGGTESQDWANMLLRMYLRFCEREGFDAEVLDMQPGEAAGIKSATLFIKGKHAYGLFKAEQGIHRLVRISPYDANKRRHTSFAGVSATPEVPEVAIEIDPGDLRIDTFRAGGAGGQHVNKTESAVRITHIPTNTVVACQTQRSQGQNKETAMKMLKAKLAQKQKEEQEAKAASVEKKKIEWGSQIRSYVLHPYKMVKDHRTDLESPQPDLVLDGDIMEFIEKYLLFAAT